MTDLNPTPNDKLIVFGVEGFGSMIAGVVAILLGLLWDEVSLAWIGAGLIACGSILVVATARQRRRRNLTRGDTTIPDDGQPRH